MRDLQSVDSNGYSRKVLPVVEKNFLKRCKKIAETEGILSAVLWSVFAVFWGSFALFCAVFHITLQYNIIYESKMDHKFYKNYKTNLSFERR